MTATAPLHPIALLESFSGGEFSRCFAFGDLERIVVARSADQVIAALTTVEQVVAQGSHAVGFVSYEAAAALNPDFPVHPSGELPLVWFGIFAERQEYTAVPEAEPPQQCFISQPELSINQQEYCAAVDRIRSAIAAGDTYQVNFTTSQRFHVSGDPFSLYRRMCRNQQAPFCAWLDTGQHRIMSASPELFFARSNDRLTMKPMKGTATRAPRGDADLKQKEQLASNVKDRAENLMIVDLVRNDLGSIAETGTVAVQSLFDIVTFPTVHQMTSTVTARIRQEVGLVDIFRALFPCGSVTGAPKRNTMSIISQLEKAPRGIYCGAIGYLSPGNEAVFSVAIRTAVMESATGFAQIGIGSGITWDSDAMAEFRECCSKSAFLVRDDSNFQLIETLRHDRDGFLLLERHLRRLADSAHYFGFSLDLPEVRRQLTELGKRLDGVQKVRLLLAYNGSLTLEADALDSPEPGSTCALTTVSPHRIDSSNPFMYHKTTRRAFYDRERQNHPDCYDVLFLNERDTVCEGSFTTLVVMLQGELLTPALDCGLLPGVMRAELLEVGAVREAVLSLQDLQRAETIWLVNSVRGWRECRLQAAEE